MKRTDLICENGSLKEEKIEELCRRKALYGTEYTDITVDDGISERFGIKKGRYITVYSGKGDVTSCMTELLKGIIPSGSALVAGLGNQNICSDSFGVKALRYIPATAHLSVCREFGELDMRRVYVIEAGVMGKTGIESSRHISETAESVSADLIVALDSLACSEPESLLSVIQITDTGISPGSGVGNDRQALSFDTAGVPVIAIGVPTVTDLDSLTGKDETEKLMVTPRNVDVSVSRLAGIIGRSVAMALNPSLSEKEIESLLIL